MCAFFSLLSICSFELVSKYGVGGILVIFCHVKTIICSSCYPDTQYTSLLPFVCAHCQIKNKNSHFLRILCTWNIFDDSRFSPQRTTDSVSSKLCIKKKKIFYGQMCFTSGVSKVPFYSVTTLFVVFSFFFCFCSLTFK